MKFPTAKYGSYDPGPKGTTNPLATLGVYAIGAPIALALVIGIFFLFYASGFWVGLYSVPCQFTQSQPKCGNWRTQRNDQHLGGNLNLQIQGRKP